MPDEKETIQVKVRFDGVVTVEVPKEIPEESRRAAAEAWALAQIVAVLDNEDAPQEEAYEHYLEQGGDPVGDAWDRITGSVSGTYGTIAEDEATLL